MAISRVISAAALRQSLNLPKTTFPMRAEGFIREPLHVDRITTQLYARQAVARAESQPFELHDGPPYANGDLHLGHLQNKVLKDIINRRALLAGRRVRYTPGWDCHGLPIELKALSDTRKPSSPQSPSGASKGSAVEVRRIAREYALSAATAQAADFQRWGVMGDWTAVAERFAAHRAYATGTAPATTTASGGDVYLTMDVPYEAAQLRAFSEMVARGCIYRAYKPVYWSPSTHTALAEAELEYADAHVSTAVVLAFPLFSVASAAGDAARTLLQSLCMDSGGAPCAALVWTTTPWTLPANVALAVNPELQYVLVRARGAPAGGALADRSFLVAEERLESLGKQLLGSEEDAAFEVLGRIKGADLEGCSFYHPLSASLPPLPPPPTARCYETEVAAPGCNEGEPRARVVPVICGTHVTADAGTGVVHTAPGHGHDDFDACTPYNSAYFAARTEQQEPAQPRGRAAVSYLHAISPVDDVGCFTAGAGASLVGLPVLGAGNEAVVECLQREGALVSVDRGYKHRYPYDWRSKKPVIVRGTKQWFVSVEHLVAQCRDALEDVAFIPDGSRNRLLAMLGSRNDWCISRQRSWGVPVPVLFNAATGESLMTPESVRHIADVLESHPQGVDAWWTEPASTFIPHGHGQGATWIKGTDTLDVWFDSGCSWAGAKAAVGAPRTEATRSLDYPAADMVLEGSDQHRGWFQSSLLTSIAATGRAPYKSIVTHGFVLDEKGHKMSKSLGNVITPSDVLTGRFPKKGARGQPQKRGTEKSEAASVGADVLRWWVASCDFTTDCAFGVTALATTTEHVRKLRNTLRFVLSALHGYQSGTSTVELQDSESEILRKRQLDQLDALAAAWSAPVPKLLQGVELERLTLLDRAMLQRLATFNDDVSRSLDSLSFMRAVQRVNAFIASDLSSQYLDACKDRLYSGLQVPSGLPRLNISTPSDMAARLASDRVVCQAVLREVLRVLVRAVAAIVPFLAEEVYQHSAAAFAPALLTSQPMGSQAREIATPHATYFDLPLDATSPVFPREWTANTSVSEDWTALTAVQSEVNRLLEDARAAQLIGSSLEARLVISLHTRAASVAQGRHARVILEEAARVPLGVTTHTPRPGNNEGLISDNGALEAVFGVSGVDVISAVLDTETKDRTIHAIAPRFSFSKHLELGSADDTRLSLDVVPAVGSKCARCWKYSSHVESHPAHVCQRCDAVLTELGVWGT